MGGASSGFGFGGGSTLGSPGGFGGGSLGGGTSSVTYSQTPERGTNNQTTGTKFTHIACMPQLQGRPIILLRYEDYKRTSGGNQPAPSTSRRL